MKPRYFALVVFFTFISLQLFSQDQIIKNSDEVIICKIKEIGLDEIKYILPDYPDDVMFAIDKEDIKQIVFENGKTLSFKQKMTDPETYKDNNKNAIKIDFLSPLSGNTTFTYERSLKPGRSIEGELGIIGLGIDPGDEDPGGVFFRFGYKFIKSPDFYLRGMRYAHLLKGSYLKPSITIGFFGRDNYYYDYAYPEPYDGNYYYPTNYTERATAVTGSIQLILGKQWVMDNSFLIDLYWGIGYGFSTNYEASNYFYSHVIMDEEFPLSISAGIKMGFLW